MIRIVAAILLTLLGACVGPPVECAPVSATQSVAICAPDVEDGGEKRELWEPSSLPIAVFIDTTMSKDKVYAAHAAVDYWNDALGFEALEARDLGSELPEIDYIVVSESNISPMAGLTIRNYDYFGRVWYANVWFDDNATVDLPMVAEHELGHALGLEHDGPGSIMSPVGASPCVQQQDLDALRATYCEVP